MVHQLPENSRGKLTREALTQLFAASEFRSPLSERPEVVEEFRGADFLERACVVPPDLACFPGHFPDDPVVPGVLEFDWALELAADLLGRSPRVETIESLKFLSPLRPGNSFRISVRISRESKLYLRLWGEESEFAKGRVQLFSENLGSEGVA